MCISRLWLAKSSMFPAPRVSVSGSTFSIVRTLPLDIMGFAAPSATGSVASASASPVLTLGFGTTLIGEAVDYAIYYLIQAKGSGGWQGWLRQGWPTVRTDDDADTAGSTSGQTNKKRKRKTKGQSANKSKGRKATGAAVVAAATAGGAGQGGRVGNPAPAARGKAQPVATICPYYLDELLGTPLAENPLRTFTCREGVKCKRGRHVPLRQLTRDEVRAAFEDASVSRFHVSSKSLELVAAAPATVFK